MFSFGNGGGGCLEEWGEVRKQEQNSVSSLYRIKLAGRIILFSFIVVLTAIKVSSELDPPRTTISYYGRHSKTCLKNQSMQKENEKQNRVLWSERSSCKDGFNIRRKILFRFLFFYDKSEDKKNSKRLNNSSLSLLEGCFVCNKVTKMRIRA